MIDGIDPGNCLRAARIQRADPDGPALLLPELSGLLWGKLVWLPFAASNEIAADDRWLGPKSKLAARSNIRDHPGEGQLASLFQLNRAIEAVYFGVPTVCENRALFGAKGWNTGHARQAARLVTAHAIERGARLIVSGLGSGDISVAQRSEDMGGGHLVATKHFGTFVDWILVRWL